MKKEIMKLDIVNFYEWDIEIANMKKDTKWIEFGELFSLEKGKLQSSKVEEDEDGDSVFINLSKNQEFKKNINQEMLKVCSERIHYFCSILLNQNKKKV